MRASARMAAWVHAATSTSPTLRAPARGPNCQTCWHSAMRADATDHPGTTPSFWTTCVNIDGIPYAPARVRSPGSIPHAKSRRWAPAAKQVSLTFRQEMPLSSIAATAIMNNPNPLGCHRESHDPSRKIAGATEKNRPRRTTRPAASCPLSLARNSPNMPAQGARRFAQAEWTTCANITGIAHFPTASASAADTFSSRWKGTSATGSGKRGDWQA